VNGQTEQSHVAREGWLGQWRAQDAAGRSMSMKNRGGTVSSGRDGPGQLGCKGSWPKPEKKKREASKFNLDNMLNDFG
jgi:hypothetical protein